MDGLHPWLAEQRHRIDGTLSLLFEEVWPEQFREPLRYALLGGGKRIRPALTLAAWEAVTQRRDPTPILPAAAAVELIHSYSLVHDDMPSLDNDDLRRGRPTVHRQWDEATAVLVGDALQTEAFACLSRCALPAELRIQMVSILASAAGAHGMVGGQVADLAATQTTPLQVVERLHSLKTGALIRTAVLLGGIGGDASPDILERLGRYGTAVGLAFQLADDVLDAAEDEGEDGPPSFVKLLGVDATRMRARTLVEEALDAISVLPCNDALTALARFTVDREV